MKLLSGLIKEVKLATRSFYFAIEIIFALIILFVLMFVIPENITKMKEERYVYLNAAAGADEMFFASLEDLDGKPTAVDIKGGETVYHTKMFENEDAKYYLLDDETDMISLAKSKGVFGVTVNIDAKTNEISYAYYLQGYETERLKNLLKVVHISDVDTLEAAYDGQEIRRLTETAETLSDRKNTMPALLTFNGSLMGLFILAAYMFVDKKQGVIKAYAVTPSPVWQYLAGKIMVVALTAVVTSLIIIIPILGADINYGWLLLFLIGGGLYASALGLLISGYYDDMEQSFGVLFLLMLIHALPAIGYYIPSWEPFWLKLIPSYYIIYGFKELIINNGNFGFVLWSTVGLMIGGGVFFLLALRRIKRTLSV